jgi:hypothetical protein
MLTNPLHLIVTRMAFYILGLPSLGALAALADWGVTIDGYTISIQFETFIGMLLGSGALSLAIFKGWGTR